MTTRQRCVQLKTRQRSEHNRTLGTEHKATLRTQGSAQNTSSSSSPGNQCNENGVGKWAPAVHPTSYLNPLELSEIIGCLVANNSRRSCFNAEPELPPQGTRETLDSRCIDLQDIPSSDSQLIQTIVFFSIYVSIYFHVQLHKSEASVLCYQ